MNPGSPTGINPEVYRRPGGIDGGVKGIFCGSPHPDNPDPETADDSAEFVFCRRLKGHQDRENPILTHAAFAHSISEPEEWD